MTRFVELSTPIGEAVYVNPDQVTQLKDKGDVTHIHFIGENSTPSFTAVHLPIHEVAKLLSSD